MKKWISGFMTYVLLAASVSYADERVNQGAGNPATQAWKVYTAPPTPGPSASGRATYAPAATTTSLTANGVACTTAGGASCTIVLASIELISWTNVTLTIRNSDGADAITNVLVEFSPDNTNWEVWDSTTFAALAAGGILSLAIAGNSRRYMRVEARAAADVTSVVVNLTMNDG
jgi:hypothetical protein